MTNIAAMLAEFHEAAQCDPIGRKEWATLRKKLLAEEFNELCVALDFGNVLDIAKEIADLVYVCYGTARYLRIDTDEAVAEVHRSNMSKFDSNGKPYEKRTDGKVLKGPHYQLPNMRVAVL